MSLINISTARLQRIHQQQIDKCRDAHTSPIESGGRIACVVCLIGRTKKAGQYEKTYTVRYLQPELAVVGTCYDSPNCHGVEVVALVEPSAQEVQQRVGTFKGHPDGIHFCDLSQPRGSNYFLLLAVLPHGKIPFTYGPPIWKKVLPFPLWVRQEVQRRMDHERLLIMPGKVPDAEGVGIP